MAISFIGVFVPFMLHNHCLLMTITVFLGAQCLAKFSYAGPKGTALYCMKSVGVAWLQQKRGIVQVLPTYTQEGRMALSSYDHRSFLHSFNTFTEHLPYSGWCPGYVCACAHVCLLGVFGLFSSCIIKPFFRKRGRFTFMRSVIGREWFGSLPCDSWLSA